MMKKRVLCVMHQRNSSTGQVGVALKQLGIGVQALRPLCGQRIPRDLGQFDGLVIFGGPMSANDDHFPGIRLELKLIERWMMMDRPIWGICLGAQLMAPGLGSLVRPSHDKRVEIGWYPLKSLGHGKEIFRSLSHVYQWHREGFELPKGTERLATGIQGAAFSEQAFGIGRHVLGTQFHPEMHSTMMQGWLTRAGHMLDLPGAFGVDNHRIGIKKNYAKQSVWVKSTLGQWLEG